MIAEFYHQIVYYYIILTILAFEFDSAITIFLVMDDVPSGASTSIILIGSSMMIFLVYTQKYPSQNKTILRQETCLQNSQVDLNAFYL